MSDVFLDFETRSRVDLKTAGVYRYAMDPSTDALCLAFAVDGGPVWVWRKGRPFPTALKRAIDGGALLHAHNAAFERLIWQHVCVPRYGWPEVDLERWRCTAAGAAAVALPRSLADAASALELEVAKDLEGKKIMLKLCRPKR